MKTNARSDSDRIADMLEAIANIEAWHPESASEGMYRAAVLHELMVIGDAASHLSETFKEAYPEIPWKDVIGLRVQLAHHYWDTLWARIEQTVDEDIPALKAMLTRPFELS
ncbi:MAG: HepT-like ribonuclease domain-containing protein [Candidatus Dormibacteraceae bacterium]